jgi:hypothetical protein
MSTPALFEITGTCLAIVLLLAIGVGNRVDNLRHKIASLKQELHIED